MLRSSFGRISSGFKLWRNRRKPNKTTLETSEKDAKTTLETSGKDAKTTLETSVVLQPPPPPKIEKPLTEVGLKVADKFCVAFVKGKYTRFECSFHIFSTRFECRFTSSPLVSSVDSHLLHSFRV